MEVTVPYLLMLQKYTSLKQNILKKIICALEIFQNILRLITWKKGLNGYAYKFSVDYKIIDTSNIINGKIWYKIIMFGFIKKIFMGLLINIANASNRAKHLLLSNQKCIIQPTVINLHPNEHSQ